MYTNLGPSFVEQTSPLLDISAIQMFSDEVIQVH